jgi:predicted RNA-binding protein YlxR (DUF448 family)
MAGKKQPRQRHIPQRTCVVCRRKMDKRELTRLVPLPAEAGADQPAGQVVVDPTGKQSGRGAYLCSRPECWDRALSTTVLEKALKTSLSAETRLQLATFRPPVGPVNNG